MEIINYNVGLAGAVPAGTPASLLTVGAMGEDVALSFETPNGTVSFGLTVAQMDVVAESWRSLRASGRLSKMGPDERALRDAFPAIPGDLSVDECLTRYMNVVTVLGMDAYTVEFAEGAFYLRALSDATLSGTVLPDPRSYYASEERFYKDAAAALMPDKGL